MVHSMVRQYMQYKLWPVFICILLCLPLTGCEKSINSSSNQSSPSQTGDTTLAQASVGAQGVKLFIEPAAGEQVITSVINNAQTSIWLEMYLLTDKKVISALENAAHRHVEVRVMLEAHPYGGSLLSPQQTLDRLQAAGIQARTSNPQFALTHEKGMIIDGRTAYIMTCNFTASALGNSQYTLNREYGIIDTSTQDVTAVQAIFNADWQRIPVKLASPRLVVSPLNSHSTFLSLIHHATTSLSIEAEELQDSQVQQALTEARQRGVQVRIILPASTGGQDYNLAGITAMQKSGVQVRQDTQLYMHAKIIVVDQKKAFVGSENISTASLDQNRELGILVADTYVLSALSNTFQQDWSNSQAER
ncbi:hypothetical protein KDW_09020 [Dictyobacter vulcani]|uniref:phospholipase D n=1 Tax=Dictyobacter vulcani TaxID=2607529 RepID=A0A5J4KK50_9CHLR|nr:phospholipase D-like domain-containing protein [Dictyobacter vulcani]GER86740.1 hypothetical protein KDW_09020 [Dictyobacter vulcani]